MTEEENSEKSAAASTHEGGESPAPPSHAGHEASASDSHGATSEDRFSPEAVAERIARVGAETDQERAEREAEELLVARRKEVGGDKRSALEIAASKRLSDIGEKAVRRPTQAVVLDAQMEPIRGPVKFYEDNKKLVHGAVAAAALVVFGGVALRSYQESKDTAASVALSAAIAAEHGHLEGDKNDARDQKEDLRPTYKTAADRTDGALAKFREVQSQFPRSGAATMARLAEGSLLLDKGDAAAALAAFEEVRNSPLAKADGEIKGRALEGVGFANELKANGESAQKTELLDHALSAYTELEQLDVKGLKELGQYHQARILEAKGDTKGAIEKLKAARAATGEPQQNNVFSYLHNVVDDRLRALSPGDVPPPKRGGMGGLPGLGGMGGSGPGGLDMSDPAVQRAMQKYMEQMQKQQGGKGPALPSSPTP